MQIFEKQYERLDPRDLSQQRAQFALHPLLRRALHIVADLLRRRALGRERRDLHEPDRRNLPHHPVEGIGRAAVQQIVERFEDRQIRFRAREPL